MVLVYIANIGNLPDPAEKPEVLAGLPQERKEKIAKIKVPHKRKQSLGAGVLLEYARKEWLKHNEDLSMYFNLSHSGDYAICAVSSSPVGCDIEKVKEAPFRVAQKHFCKCEVEYLNSIEKGEKDEQFFRLWTIKESYTKMMGKGLSMGLSSFQIAFEDEIILLKDGEKIDCHIKEYELEGYRISVCSEDNSYKEKLITVEI